jgi:hypothetical protein
VTVGRVWLVRAVSPPRAAPALPAPAPCTGAACRRPARPRRSAAATTCEAKGPLNCFYGTKGRRLAYIGSNSCRKPQPMTADRPMTAAQEATLKTLAQAAYELDAFKPNLTRTEADKRIAMLTAKLKLLDEPPHTL